MDFLLNNASLLGGGGLTAIVLFVLKKVPNDDISAVVEKCFFGLGRTITLGLAKWSLTKKLWNSTIEPYFVDLVDNVVGGAVRGFLRGLRADNE